MIIRIKAVENDWKPDRAFIPDWTAGHA